MKNTVVPAQITTVEDKIAGNLGFNQLLLMTVPVFFCAALFAITPPSFSLTPLKYVIGVTVTLLCLILSLRIRGQIVLYWAMIIGKYLVRPRYFIYNKNDVHLRRSPEVASGIAVVPVVNAVIAKKHATHLPTPILVRTESAVQNPESRFYITNGKGGLRVNIREIPKENI